MQSEDFSVYVTCKGDTEKILPISFERGGRTLEDKASDGAVAQARSVIGSLARISRQARSDICYQCSRLQSTVSIAKVMHLIQCNKVLKDTQATSSVGVYF